MRTRNEVFGQLFDVGKDILHTAVSATTKVVLAQFGDSSTQQVDGQNAELWQLPGVFCTPAAATPGSASCQGIALKGGDRERFFAYRDTRAAATCADHAPGDSSFFGTGTACNANNGRIVSRATGALEMRSTVGIDLGGGATDHVALASKVDAITADLKTFAQTASALTPVPSSGITPPQLAAFVGAANALAASISSVASALIKAK